MLKKSQSNNIKEFPKVKLFQSLEYDYHDLEKSINDFLNSLSSEQLIDIKYTCTRDFLQVMIIYKEIIHMI